MDVKLEKRLVKKAVKYSLPTEPLLHAFRARRILSNPGEWMRRRAVARKICETSPFAGFIDREKGYRLFGPDDLPGVMAAVKAARRLFAVKEKADLGADAKKSFYYNILDPSEIDLYPELLEFATSQAVVDAATGYLGSLPQLGVLGVFYSPAGNGLEKSQLYHIDDEDLKQIKCFVNVSDVKPENGPFTFLPADRSRAIRKKMSHHWRGPRLSDEQLGSMGGGDAELSLLGKAGTGGMVDTSSCLHFGSRCKRAYRLVIMFQYNRYPDVTLLTKEELLATGRGVAGELADPT